jgi:hypothetical protein
MLERLPVVRSGAPDQSSVDIEENQRAIRRMENPSYRRGRIAALTAFRRFGPGTMVL